MRILIAEHDPVCRWLARKAIAEELGEHEIVEAEDGLQAWEAIAGPCPPDLAVVGWLLPVVNGIELCRRVRSEPRLAATYLIVLTVKCGRSHMREALDAGADDFLGRPFRPDDLCARARLGLRIASLQKGLPQDAQPGLLPKPGHEDAIPSEEALARRAAVLAAA